MVFRNSSFIPIPLSQIRNTKSAEPSFVDFFSSTCIMTEPPACVYLMAFESTLSSTWFKRSLSHMIPELQMCVFTSNERFFASTSACTMSLSVSIISTRFSAFSDRDILPDSMRLMSSTSLISESKWFELCPSFFK